MAAEAPGYTPKEGETTEHTSYKPTSPAYTQPVRNVPDDKIFNLEDLNARKKLLHQRLKELEKDGDPLQEEIRARINAITARTLELRLKAHEEKKRRDKAENERQLAEKKKTLEKYKQ